MKILRIDLYSNSHIVNRVSVFLERSVHDFRSREKDLVKKLGQKEVGGGSDPPPPTPSPCACAFVIDRAVLLP